MALVINAPATFEHLRLHFRLEVQRAPLIARLHIYKSNWPKLNCNLGLGRTQSEDVPKDMLTVSPKMFTVKLHIHFAA